MVPDTLTLTDAMVLALQGNPGLAAFSFEARAAEARVLQARLLPNPGIEMAVDEYDRGGSGFNSAESVVALGQVFELGRKRHWRTRVAEAQGELAGWDYEAKRLDVLTETARRFMTVMAAQERLGILRSAAELAEGTSRAVLERVDAGKEPPLQAAKSDAELEMARLDAQAALSTLESARRNLAAMWGATEPAFQSVQGSLHNVLESIPGLEELRPLLRLNPDLARWETELGLRQAALASEKAARIPDLDGSLGIMQFEEDETDALAFSMGFPLPLFDRNQGNIAAARHGLSKVEAERAAAEVALDNELASAHAELEVFHKRVATLRDKVVPAMEQAFHAAHQGYQQGKFGFLDMLDAQRGLFQAREAFVDALLTYQTTLIDIQRLTGSSIGTRMNFETEN